MFELFVAELRRRWTEFLRYPSEAIGLIFITTITFYGLFLGARYVAGPGLQFGERLDSLVVGYVLWNLVGLIMADISGQIQYENRTGTLEQLFLSCFGSQKVFLMRTLASLSLRLFLSTIIALIVISITGAKLAFPPILILPLVTILLGAYGLAFTLGSSTLLLKRTEQLVNLIFFPMLFLMATPTETWTGWGQIVRWLLPMTGGAGLMRDLMARGEVLDPVQFTLALLNGITYFTIGMLIFRIAERETKRRGTLGGY
jgi:ABC-2 type transport system permease protein